jgi:hypothetical protein
LLYFVTLDEAIGPTAKSTKHYQKHPEFGLFRFRFRFGFLI